MIIDKEINPRFKGKENSKCFSDLPNGSKSEPSLNFYPHTIIINETALYKLIFRSKVELAEQFQD